LAALGFREIRVPYYRVILHGTGIRFVYGDETRTANGFYTSRGVRAGSAEEAVQKAKASVLATWSTQEYVSANKGGMPQLSSDTVEQVSFWQARKIPKTGHTFYAEDP